MPTAFARPRFLTRFIQFNWHSTLASATAPDHMYCPRSRQRPSSGNRPYTETGVCYTPLCSQ
jgi:hypothetical protein